MQIAQAVCGKLAPLLRISFLLSMIVFFSLAIGDAVAKLIDVSLAELVSKSQVIARGHTARAEKDGLKVWFEAEEVMKGSVRAREKLVLCNDPNDRESHDLAVLNVSYFLFASRQGDCYQAVHGVSSIVTVSKDTVLTVAIADQPARQTTGEFASKIRLYLRQ